MDNEILSAEQPGEGSAGTEEYVCVCDDARDTAQQKAAQTDKFHSSEALRRAYEALEAEFTRKSQQLAELRREHEHIQQKNAGSRAVEEFIRRYPKAADMETELMERIDGIARNIPLEDGLRAAYMDILDKRYESREQIMADEQFLEKCAQNQRIKQMVIREYLEAACRGNSPAVLAGGYIPVRERNRARTLEDAGEMTKGLYK